MCKCLWKESERQVAKAEDSMLEWLSRSSNATPLQALLPLSQEKT
jgi:hypothetical protein